jgi:hypothetical protein
MKGQSMAKIINFPNSSRAELNQKSPPESELTRNKDLQHLGKSGGVVKVLWVAAVLLWPWVKWFVVLDVLFQFGRMVYHWNTPSTFAGWTFLLHFGVLTAITYYVSMFKPKDF